MVYALAAQSVVRGPAVQASPESSVRKAESQVLSIDLWKQNLHF